MSVPSLASAHARTVARVAAAAPALAPARTVRGIATAACTVAFALALLVPVGAALQIVLSAQLDDHTATQAIVVLDPARYWGDAEPVMEERLAHAAELYGEGVAPVIVVTGPQRSVAAERRALMSRGVDARDVVWFDSGRDTVGALQVVAGVMRDLNWSAATIVTDPAHAARAQATAAALGIDAHLSPTEAGPGTALTSEYVGRETLALLRFHLLTRWSLPTIVR